MTEADVWLVRVFYFGLFIGVFALFLQWETGHPKCLIAESSQRRRHVLRNFSMLGLVILVADLIVGEFLFHAYAFLYQPPVIFLEAMVLPLGMQIVLAFLISDLLEYGLHVASHKIGWFWKLHAVHHTDTHLDVTTAGRSHPLNISIYVVAKLGVYLLLGLPFWIEGLRAIFHNTLLCIQHANVNYPRAIERMRGVLVTPAMHRVHHSNADACMDSNYGFIFSFWDRLFGTYRRPIEGESHRFGLAGCEGEEWQSIKGMLFTPLRSLRRPSSFG